MVSSVLVELMADGDEAPSSTGDGGDSMNCVLGLNGALGIGKEGILSVEVEWHVNT